MGAATTVFFEVQLKDDVLRGRSNVADLGDVHLRWVTPMSGLTNRQASAITSQFDRELGTTGDPLLEFGSNRGLGLRPVQQPSVRGLRWGCANS